MFFFFLPRDPSFTVKRSFASGKEVRRSSIAGVSVGRKCRALRAASYEEKHGAVCLRQLTRSNIALKMKCDLLLLLP